MDENTNPLTDETEFPSDDPWTEALDRQAERRPAAAEAHFDEDFLPAHAFEVDA